MTHGFQTQSQSLDAYYAIPINRVDLFEQSARRCERNHLLGTELGRCMRDRSCQEDIARPDACEVMDRRVR